MFKKVFLGLCAVLLIAGCNFREQITQEEFDAVVTKQTTQKEVKEMFGSPHLVTGLKGEIWSYTFVVGTDSLGTDIRQTVNFEFDEDGVVFRKYNSVWPRSIFDK